MEYIEKQPEIKNLALIGDRRTCALIGKDSNILWYAPERFDKATILTGLLDSQKGGFFRIICEDLQFSHREYVGDSSILKSTFKNADGEFTLTDWMPLKSGFSGICRHFSQAPSPIQTEIHFRGEYGQEEFQLIPQGSFILLKGKKQLYLKFSHSYQIEGNKILFSVPQKEEGWVIISETDPEQIQEEQIYQSLESTRKEWERIQARITYHGPYEEVVRNCLRAIRLLTDGENGGIIAAATTSLPEVLGGERNYDYRYVWLRDTAMIVSALTRAGSDGIEERKFLSFICDAKYINKQESLVPFYALDKKVAPEESYLDLKGYRNSQPVRIGNNAKDQLQLDANANVLLAAKLIYNRFGEKDHWETVQDIADYLVEHWEEPDHGIWEENLQTAFHLQQGNHLNCP